MHTYVHKGEKMFKMREKINTLTHLFGICIGFIYILIMFLNHMNKLNLIENISIIIYGLSIIGLYTASTIYHWINGPEKLIVKLKKFDHMMIFVLISGTYTPLCLLVLPSTIGNYLLIFIWILTILGIFFKMFWIKAPRFLYTLIYVIMGWACVLVFPTLLTHINIQGIWFLASGGISYTIGAVIYGLKKSPFKSNVFKFHEQFHIFVLIGTLLHFLTINLYVL